MKMLDLALQYLEEYGFSIIPVRPGQEGPNKAKSPYLKEIIPYRSRKPTREEVIEWWTKWPQAMIAMPVGELNNAMAIDADTLEAVAKMEELLPDSFECPIVKTPRNDISKHFYFKYCPDVSNASPPAIPIEVKARDLLIILPGSIRSDGRQYELMNGCDLKNLPELPSSITSYLFSLCLYARTRGSTWSAEVSKVSGSQQYWRDGESRDTDLFHAANHLIKGGCPPDFADNILNIVVNSWGENEPRWVHAKIKSAMDRAARRDRNIAQELRDWVNESVGGQFKVSDWYRESAVVSKQDKHSAIVALKKLCDEGIVERIGKRTGEYRIIEKDFTVQQWWQDEGVPLSIELPLAVHTLAKIFPGNIILLEGEKSQGKSAFALEFCRMNRKLFKSKIRYLNIEMSDSELLERFNSYPQDLISKNEWRESVEFIKRTSDWWDLIEPDGINVVDYLVEYEKSYLIAQFIFNIHQKLKSGIALVVIQRDPFKPYGVGGRGVRDIPRLVLSLMHHKIKLEDVKSFYPLLRRNPTGYSRPYKQVSWWNFQAQDDWTTDNKYKDFQEGDKGRDWQND